MKSDPKVIRFSDDLSSMAKNNKLPYFKFGLQGDLATSNLLLLDYPMEARNVKIDDAQRKALNAILSNIPTGDKLAVRNFGDLKNDQWGFSRKILLDVFNHLMKSELLVRDGKEFSKSVITFSNKIKRYIPEKIIYYPESTIFNHLKGEVREVVKINTAERRELNRRLKVWWQFIKQHNIDTGLTTLDFNVFNDCETQVYGKPPLIKPDHTDILPYIIFNDRDLTKGGRMYGAFWIGMKKELRRGIMIDGAKTCDIDGKGMHVQLLYREAGEPLPEGELYFYSDKRREITKGLMLLMMNTATEVSPELGRKQVKRTFRKKYKKENGKEYENHEELDEYILELEGLHHKITRFLYKPNWGHLQKTEAAIMLNIMETAMNEGIVVLPVHDGCICKIEHRERVLQIFKEQGIEADENIKHLSPVPLEKAKAFLEAFYALQEVA